MPTGAQANRKGLPSSILGQLRRDLYPAALLNSQSGKWVQAARHSIRVDLFRSGCTSIKDWRID